MTLRLIIAGENIKHYVEIAYYHISARKILKVVWTQVEAKVYVFFNIQVEAEANFTEHWRQVFGVERKMEAT